MKWPRPWGQLPWLLGKLPNVQWSFLGAIGPEARGISTWSALARSSRLQSTKFLEIRNDVDGRWSREVNEQRQLRLNEFFASHGNESHLERHALAERHGRIVDAARQWAAGSNGSLLVDISVMPKRFFFPILKVALGTPGIENVVATYTVPARYSPGPLAEDPAPWNVLPMFMNREPEPEGRLLVVGVGHEPLGLPRLLESDEFRGMDVRMLLPFPSSPIGVRKNWEFLKRCETATGPRFPDPVRTDAYNVSEVFDKLNTLSDHGRIYTHLAPFGPKTMSLGMCLFAIARDMPVFYTQPRFYNPHYSEGVDAADGAPRTYAYALMVGGIQLYENPEAASQ